MNADSVAPKHTDALHAVAIIGGATAGAEVATRLAERGVYVVVFEQNRRPFGKIEDGLPRWHSKLRDKEYERITEALTHPNIDFVPCTAIGRDVDFRALLEEWRFSAVVLANGAWRDRPLQLASGPAPETLEGHGFEYQNPFVIAFNHADDSCWEGRAIEIPTGGGAVIGGGLAAVDMAKILNLTAVQRELAERGQEHTIEHLEHEGLDKVLDAAGLSLDDLGIAPATIYYRKRIEDMAVVSMPEGADDERRAKIEATRQKFVDKLRAKYLIEIEPGCLPHELVVEDGRVTGLVLTRSTPCGANEDPHFTRPASVVISSIGSIPEPIAGLAMHGELFDTSEVCPSRLAGYPNVFAVGNVLTGKGNITVSRKHAISVSEEAIETYLGIADEATLARIAADPRPGPAKVVGAAGEVSDEVAAYTQTVEPIPAERLADIERRVGERQAAVGYKGELAAWIAASGGPC